jgi:DNA-binding XRE family transcriptional regulator
VKQIKLTRVQPIGMQGNLFGADTPEWPPHTRKLGDAIRAEYNELRLTPSEAARRLGVDKRAVEEMVRGEYEFDLNVAKAMIARHG